MNSVVQFSWSRLEGIGLIGIALAIGLAIQIPTTFFALVLLFFDLNEFYISLIGTIIGNAIILGTVICSITEDLTEGIVPNMKRLIGVGIVISVIFLVSYFSFFFLESFLPPELSNLTPEQRYFSATGLAIISMGLTTLIVYKGRKILK